MERACRPQTVQFLSSAHTTELVWSMNKKSLSKSYSLFRSDRIYKVGGLGHVAAHVLPQLPLLGGLREGLLGPHLQLPPELLSLPDVLPEVVDLLQGVVQLLLLVRAALALRLLAVLGVSSSPVKMCTLVAGAALYIILDPAMQCKG